MTKLILVRHGQSTTNIDGLFAGQLDAALSKKGILQAEKTAVFLSGMHVDVIYSSDLKRAYDTGKKIARAMRLAVIPDPAFREICGGDWEGVPFTELSRWPEEYALWKDHIDQACPPGGESLASIYERVLNRTQELIERHAGKTVLITTHATPVRLLAMHALGLPLERLREVAWSTNASITIIEIENGQWHLILDSFDKHITDLRSTLPPTI